MENWIIYIMKCSICLALLYLPFWRFLRKETFFFFNRYALLGITALSFILPLINIPEMSPKLVEVEILPIHWENIEVLAYEEQGADRPVDWMSIIGWIYVIGVLACFIYKMRDLIRLLRFIPKGCLWMEKENGLYIHCHIGKVVPFSWMNHIVISEADYQENGEAILLHEKAHIACRHSWDVMWLAVVEVLQWFNPFVWMLSNDIQDIHEYEADLSVLRQGVDAKNYQRLIIRKAVSSGSYAFANSFNHSSLKKRITMMMKKKSNPWARAKYLYVLPLATVAIAAFARPEVSNEANEISSVKVNDLASIAKVEEAKSVENSLGQMVLNTDSVSPVKEKQIFQVVEEMPEYPGGLEECMKFLSKNIKYPVEAHKNGIQGRVIVSFVITDEGDIEDPVVVRGVDPLLDAEALRVIKLMPKWKPGKQRGKAVNVKFTLPIMFRLSSEHNQLIIVDGEEKGTDPELIKNFTPQNIKSMSVVKGEEAVRVWGEKGKNGVIIIETKNAESAETEEETFQVFLVVEEMPEFPGGMAECMNFLGKNLKYPAEAQKNGIQGRVLVTFIITDEGDIKDPVVVGGVDPLLDAEALRLIKMMPKWKPGKQRGKAVNVKFTLPVEFRLQ